MNSSISRHLLPLSLLAVLTGCTGEPLSIDSLAIAQPPGSAATNVPQTIDRPASALPAGLKSTVILGDDKFLAPPSQTGAVVVRKAGGAVTLNFTDADIREVVRSILGDILQINYTIDPDVAGNVTIQTSRPLARADLVPTLESLLQTNNAVLIRDSGVFKVAALKGGAQKNFALRRVRKDDSGASGFGLQAVPLQHIAASEMVEILRLFAPEGRVLKADGARNLLLFSGTQEDRSALLDAIDLFDVDQFSGMSFGLFPLRNAKAETLVVELQAIFGTANSPLSNDLLRLVPVSRMNAVIAISPRAQYLEKAKAWIERLDKGVDSVGPRLNVYKVQNVRASDLAEILEKIFDKPAVKASAQIGKPQFVPATPRQESAKTNTAPAAPPTPPQGQDAAPGRVGGGIAVTGNGQVRIIADDSTNALLILATPDEYRMVEQSIRKLDVVPLQVLIEATIVEVTLNDALRYGVQWFLDSGKAEFSLSEAADGVATQTFPGFSTLFRSGPDVRVVLNALESVTDINVVSSPQLVVLDNQTAELQVGDQVPIATRSAVSVENPQAPVVNSIEFRDTGVILRVTPRVNAGGLVVMDVAQEVSSVVNTTTSGIDSPTIQQRKINSSVAIQSGEMVTLGGLISESRTRASTGVPVLSSIPLIGALFGRKNDSLVRTELLVLITPRVIANKIDARRITAELRGRLSTLKPLIKDPS